MRHGPYSAWLPVVALPIAMWWLTPEDWPRWMFMWLLAFAIFVGCKWLSWWTTPNNGVSIARQIGYWIAWPGFDIAGFYRTLPAPSRRVVGGECLHSTLFLLAAGKLAFV